MTYRYIKDIKFKSFRNLFVIENKNKKLEQQMRLENFIQDNNIGNLHKIIINDSYLSLEELSDVLVNESKKAENFLYVAVNKFLIYSNTDNNYFDNVSDYDLKLVRFCEQQLKLNFNLMHYHTDSNDHGTIGNFMHPVTNLFLKRHA